MPFKRPLQCLLLVLLLSSTVSCTRLFFFPQIPLIRTPSDLGYDFEDVWLSSADGTELHAWWLPSTAEPAGTVYFLHGNAENISTHIGSVLWLVDAGYQVMLLDYRGYGRSAGTPDLPEVLDDIDAGFAALQSRFTEAGNAPLIVFGQSLGASLAVNWLTRFPEAQQQVDGVILEAAFTRYGSIARHVASGSWLTWWAQYPVQWLIPDRYDPIDSIGTLEPLPLLIVHSPDDQIIPLAHGQALFAAARSPKRFVESRGPHTASANHAPTRAELLTFIQSLHPPGDHYTPRRSSTRNAATVAPRPM